MEKNTSIGAIAGVGIVLVIAFVFALFPADSEDTIFFIQKDGSTPEPCTGNVGLVLAQNITDLCDVTIISPTTNQIIQYNGSQWVNVASATFNDTTTCNNIGVGNAFVCVEGTNVDLRSLLNGTGIIVSNNTNTITITNSLPEATTGSNLGSGTGVFSANVFASEVGNDLQFKTLFNDDGELSIQNWNSTHVRINNIFPETTQCNNSTGGFGICINDIITLRNLVAGSSISLSSNATHITITNTGVTSLTSADTATLSFNASSGNVLATPTLKKLCEFTGVGGETSISCNFSSSQQVFYFQVHWNSSASSTGWALKFNNDSGTNYSSRSATNGGADATVNSQAFLASQTSTANQMNTYIMDCHNHMSTMIKWCNGDRMNIAPGANAPGRVELYSTWRNITDNVTSIDMTRTSGAGTLIAGSHIIVWGYS
jgi:hypothetical protein